MFKFNDKFKKLIMKQITTTEKNLNNYTLLSENEYTSFRQYLYPYPTSILELGCGLGRMSIFLNSKHPGDTKYYLADASEITSTERMYGWNPESWYNDLNLTKEFCELNNLKNLEIIDLIHESLDRLKDIDLVFSVMSVGFHYPIEQYFETLKKIMKKSGIMIFGVRKGIYENSSFLSNFEEVNFYNILNENKERILVLKGWK